MPHLRRNRPGMSTPRPLFAVVARRAVARRAVARRAAARLPIPARPARAGTTARSPQLPVTDRPGRRRRLLGPGNPEPAAAAVCTLVVLYHGAAGQLPWTTPPWALALAGASGAGTAYVTACHVAAAARRARPQRRTLVAELAVTALSPLVTLAGWLLLAGHAPQLVRPVAAWYLRHAGDLAAAGLLLGLVLGLALLRAGRCRPATRTVSGDRGQGRDR